MSNKKGEIATILTIGSLVVLGVVSLISSRFLQNKIKTQPRATSCSQVNSVRFSPSSINAGQTFTCNLSGSIVNQYTMACGWSKNGGWPLGQRSGSCSGNSCTFQVKMEDQVDRNATYELIGFDSRDECGPVTGKRVPLTVAGVTPQPTPTLPPGQGDCEEGKRDITGACNPACCNSHDQCPSNQLCNISNGYCRSGFSCNPNSFIPPTATPTPTRSLIQAPTPTPSEEEGYCVYSSRDDCMKSSLLGNCIGNCKECKNGKYKCDSVIPTSRSIITQRPATTQPQATTQPLTPTQTPTPTLSSTQSPTSPTTQPPTPTQIPITACQDISCDKSNQVYYSKICSSPFNFNYESHCSNWFYYKDKGCEQGNKLQSEMEAKQYCENAVRKIKVTAHFKGGEHLNINTNIDPNLYLTISNIECGGVFCSEPKNPYERKYDLSKSMGLPEEHTFFIYASPKNLKSHVMYCENNPNNPNLTPIPLPHSSSSPSYPCSYSSYITLGGTVGEVSVNDKDQVVVDIYFDFE